MSRFVVLDERKDEIFEEIFDTLEDANRFAESEWSRMTKYDRKGRRVWVGEDRTGEYGTEDDNGVVNCDLWAVERGFDSDSISNPSEITATLRIARQGNSLSLNVTREVKAIGADYGDLVEVTIRRL